MLRSAPHIITTTKLFNMSMHIWKKLVGNHFWCTQSKETIMHSNLLKYCPISLLLVLSTVLEHHMHEQPAYEHAST